MTVTVCYFASMRDLAGCDREEVTTNTTRPDQLYEELKSRHHFPHQTSELAIALNDHFSSWDAVLSEGDVMSLLPPVSGG